MEKKQTSGAIVLAAWIMQLVMMIAPQYGVPPYLVAAIIIRESQGNPNAVGHNADGTFDGGLMQLNSSWFNGDWKCAQTNITAGCKLLKEYYDYSDWNWWQVCIAYNWGIGNYIKGKKNPNEKAVNYACDVFEIWSRLEPNRHLKSYGRL
jgi:soluble lytic murein transglycosylase-like protein